MSSPGAPDTGRSGRLSDAALTALGLREQPFAAPPAGETGVERFADDVTAEQLAEIRQALITGDDLLLILGEPGSGKSVLLEQLAANSGLRIQCFSVSGGPRFSTRNLFTGMLEAFKVEPPAELKGVLDELIPCLQAMLESNKLCVVVLDDAHTLAPNELTTLLSGMLYINSRDESLLRVALATPPDFEDRIPDLLPEGADLPYSSLALEPFDAVRAGDYLAFRLAAAGREDELPFDESEIAALNERAGGRPAALHGVFAAALERDHGLPDAHAADASGAHDVDPGIEMPPELVGRRPAAGGFALGGRAAKLALGSLAGLLIVGGLLLFRPAPEPGENEARYRLVEERKVETARETERLRLLQEEEESRTADAGAAPDDGQLALAPETGPDTGIAASGAAGPGRSGSDLTGSATTEAAPRAESAPSAAPEERAAAPEAVSDRAPDAAAASETAPDAASEAAPDTASDVSRPAASAEEAPTPDAASPGESVTREDGAAPAAPDSRSDDTAPATGGSGAGSEPSGAETSSVGGALSDDALLGTEESAAPPAVEPQEPEQPGTPASGVLESANWVLVQDPAQFTVQMSASTDRDSVENFLRRTNLPAPNSIFAFDRNGTTWYALVHGLYPSISEARRAIERMPARAQSNQPWIRAIGRIQEALKEGN